MPARHPEQLVALFSSDTKTGRANDVAYEDYLDFRDRSGVFDGLAGMTGIPLNLVAPAASGSSAADMVWGEMVTENYFTVLDMRPTVGRLFTAADAPQGANPFAVLSYDSWKQRFHGDSSVVGRRVRINGTEFTITGVAARGFKGMRTFGFWPEIWAPVGMHNVLQPGSAHMLEGRGPGWMMVFGRMRPGFDRGADGARRGGAVRATTRQRLSGDERQHHRATHPRRSRLRQSVVREAEDARPRRGDGTLRVGDHAADHLRESRQPAAGPRRGAAVGRSRSASPSAARAAG